MALNNNSAASETLSVEDRVLFWEGIYEKHYHQPAPPVVPDTDSATSLGHSIVLITVALITKYTIL